MCTCITHMNDIPTGSWSKDGQQTPLPTIQILYFLLRLEISFLFCCLRQIPVEAGNEELRLVRENKPSCNQVGEHCSRPITTLLDKSLFSLHTVSTWCYHFSLNSIKNALSAPMKNGIVLRWAHSFVQVSHMRQPTAIWLAETLQVYYCEKPSWTQIIIKPWALFWLPLKKNRQLCTEKEGRQNFSFSSELDQALVINLFLFT